MWVRKKIEIRTRELLLGLSRCAWPHRRDDLKEAVAHTWTGNPVEICLSVRSGFDLLLQTSGWEAGSEIIMSGLTIPDMPRIVRENNLVPVGVDVDLDTMAPTAEGIESRVTPRSKAIVIAHLFGGLCNINRILEVARRHNLVVIEDCAQAYVGGDYRGDARTDVSMFSFGPIKTNTALGGGLLRIQDPAWLARVRTAQRSWPVQSRLSFARRIGKYAMVRLLSTRLICGLVYRALHAVGRNHDALATRMARGFAGPGFFAKIRKQPSAPLLHLLLHKLKSFDSRMIVRRQKLGNLLADHGPAKLHIVGSYMQRPTYWVLPVLAEEPDRLVETLWAEGFDASRNCSLVWIEGYRTAPKSPPPCQPESTSRFILDHVVFLPFDVHMPRAEILRMAEIINRTGCRTPALPRSTADATSAARSGKSDSVAGAPVAVEAP